MAGARSTDPSTSHDAAREAESSGRAAGQRLICLRQVRSVPGLTAAEIAARTGLERHVPSRRLPELREEGYVGNGSERACGETGRRSMTWNPVVWKGVS
jgi:CRP-like cAMP-binding protein